MRLPTLPDPHSQLLVWRNALGNDFAGRLRAWFRALPTENSPERATEQQALQVSFVPWEGSVISGDQDGPRKKMGWAARWVKAACDDAAIHSAERCWLALAPEHTVRVPFVLVGQDQVEAEVLDLVFDLYAGGDCGGLAQDPTDVLRRPQPAPDYLEALDHAWREALKFAKETKPPLVFWRIEKPSHPEPLAWELPGRPWWNDDPLPKGPSVGGAALRGLCHLLKRQTPDEGVFVLAQLNSNGRLVEVRAAGEKIKAAREQVQTWLPGHAPLIILPGQGDQKASGDTVFADDAASLHEIRSPLILDIREYADRLSRSNIPLWRKKGGEAYTLDEIAVTVDLEKKVRKLRPVSQPREDELPVDGLPTPPPLSAKERERRESSEIIIWEEYTETERVSMADWEKGLIEEGEAHGKPLRALVVGGPGTGKTFLTRRSLQLRARALKEKLEERPTSADWPAIPLRVELSDWIKEYDQTPTRPGAALIESADELRYQESRDLPHLKAWLKSALDHGPAARLFILVDGVDQAIDHFPAVAETLSEWPYTIVFTCRPRIYTLQGDTPQEGTQHKKELINHLKASRRDGAFHEYTFPPWTPEQVQALAEKLIMDPEAKAAWSTAYQAGGQLEQICSMSAFLATSACLLAIHQPELFPPRGILDSRSDIYRQLLRYLLKQAKVPESSLDLLLDDLQKHAWLLLQASPSERSFEAKLFRAAWGKLEYPEGHASHASLVGLLKKSGLWEGGPSGRLSIAHRSFLEYLAASHLAGLLKASGKWETLVPYCLDDFSGDELGRAEAVWNEPVPKVSLLNLVDHKIWDPKWLPTLEFLFEQMPELRGNPKKLATEVMHTLIRYSVDEPVEKEEGYKRLFATCRLASFLPLSLESATGQAAKILCSVFRSNNNVLIGQAIEVIAAWMRMKSQCQFRPDFIAILIRNLATEHVSFAIEGLLQLTDNSVKEEIIAALFRVLTDEKGKESVRLTAARTLGNIGRNLPHDNLTVALLGCLSASDPTLRKAAADGLGYVGAKALRDDVISALHSNLSDGNWDVVSAAISTLGMLGRMAGHGDMISASNQDAVKMGNTGDALRNRIISILLSCMSKDNRKRLSAIFALGFIGKFAACDEVISSLLRCLEDDASAIRLFAVEALGAMGENAGRDDVISALEMNLRVEKTAIIRSTTHALGMIGPKAARDDVIASLYKCTTFGADRRDSGNLQLPDTRIYSLVVETLDKFGHKAAAAHESVFIDLSMQLSHKNEEIACHAASALSQMQTLEVGEEVIASLLSCVLSHDSERQEVSAIALGRLVRGAACEQVLSCVREAISSNEHRNVCKVLLYEMREKASCDDLISTVLDWLREDDDPLTALDLLNGFGQKAARADVVATLAHSCGHRYKSVSYAAMDLLVKFEQFGWRLFARDDGARACFHIHELASIRVEEYRTNGKSRTRQD